MSTTAPRAGIGEDADHGRVPAGQHARHPAAAPGLAIHAGAAGGRLFDQHLVTLHGAVQLSGRNEEIVLSRRRAVGPHKAEAVPMQIEPACDQPVACHALLRLPRCRRVRPHAGRLFRSSMRQSPLFRLQLHQLAPQRDARQLLQQQTPLAPTAQPKLPH